MRLDFNVLWVEDQPAEVEAQSRSIAKQMAEEGFHFNPFTCQSLDKVKELIAKDVFTDEIDLILVDWDLGSGVHGEDAIATIRDEEAFRYKDVIFYSALKPAGELRELATEKELDGIFYTSREDLVGEVIGVFESLIKKVLDLDHTRGIVMGATSDIDHLVNECLLHMHAKLAKPGQEALLKQMLERIQERIDDITKRANKLLGAATADTVFASHEIFTSADRLRILSRVLKDAEFKEHAEKRPTVVAYLEDVVPGRTTLAHVVLVPEGKPEGIMSTQGKVFTLDQTRDLRKQILKSREDFRDLLAALKKAQ